MGRLRVKKLIQKLIFISSHGRGFEQRYYLENFKLTQKKSDISDHLNNLFWHVMEARPDYIVELGTRGGESTKVLLRAARELGIKMLSVDINDCGNIDIEGKDHWTFIQADDVDFGKNVFREWCRENGLNPKAGFIFIDTSHLYEHTKDEIAVWSEHLAPGGVMVFHDTNMGKVYARLDGSLGYGWDNDRGVIRAIEEFLGRRYDENTFFTDYASGFLVRHYPNCSGMTVIKRMDVD